MKWLTKRLSCKITSKKNLTNQVEPDKIIAKFKRGLHAFWKSHVNTLNEPIGNENTDIFNLLQHLFTIEGEKQILKDKRGDNNVLEDVFMDDFKP